MKIKCPVCGCDYTPSEIFVSLDDTTDVEVFKCEKCDCEFTVTTVFETCEVAEKCTLWE